jgi:hypothetical protein
MDLYIQPILNRFASIYFTFIPTQTPTKKCVLPPPHPLSRPLLLYGGTEIMEAKPEREGVTAS